MTHKKVPTPMARRKRGWGIDLRFSRQNRIKSTIKSINYNSLVLLSFIYPFDFIYISLPAMAFLPSRTSVIFIHFFNDLFLNEQNQQIKATPFPPGQRIETYWRCFYCTKQPKICIRDRGYSLLGEPLIRTSIDSRSAITSTSR